MILKERISKLDEQITELHNSIQLDYRRVKNQNRSQHSQQPHTQQAQSIEPESKLSHKNTWPYHSHRPVHTVRRCFSVDEGYAVREIVPSKLVIEAWVSSHREADTVPSNAIPVLKLSSSQGELLPMEEAGSTYSANRREGGEEGGARQLKLSSIASCSDRETPDPVESGNSSRNSSVASVEMTFSDGGNDECDHKMAAPEDKSKAILHSPQSAVEDDVFFTT